jgi:copper(I)-binding protein
MRWAPKPLLAGLSLSVGTALLGSLCFAHGYRFGFLEIVHPAIMVPKPGSSQTCANLTIFNHGTTVERLKGLRVEISEEAYLTKLGQQGRPEGPPLEVSILPGEKINLRKAGWCLLLSGLKVRLEADVGTYPASLIFEQTGEIEIEFMCDSP